MKKLLSIFVWLLVTINVFSPVCELIARIASLKFELFGYTAAALIMLLLMLIPCVLTFFSEKSLELNKRERIACSLIPIASCLNLLFFIIKSDSAALAVLAFLNFVLSIYLSKKLGEKRSFIASLISSIPVMVLVLFVIMLRPMMSWVEGDLTIVERVESPDGEYCAEVVKRGTGASGGETYVRVYSDTGLDLAVFSFTPYAKKIYSAGWQEEVHISFEGNELFINGEAYEVSE